MWVENLKFEPVYHLPDFPSFVINGKGITFHGFLNFGSIGKGVNVNYFEQDFCRTVHGGLKSYHAGVVGEVADKIG